MIGCATKCSRRQGFLCVPELTIRGVQLDEGRAKVSDNLPYRKTLDQGTQTIYIFRCYGESGPALSFGRDLVERIPNDKQGRAYAKERIQQLNAL